jgi:hypothetical protein
MPTIDGPSEGEIDVEYAFTAITTDPEEHDIYYFFDWGDGTDSGWLGPYASGDEGEAIHAWEEVGTYEVTVKAKDIYDSESEFSTPLEITISEPAEIEIGEIVGGLGITATINNVGSIEVTNIDWTISIEGGFIILTPEESGTIDSVPAGESEIISMSVLGIGLGIITESPTITVTATFDNTTVDETVTARILGPLVLL